jgi:hypothetical protein
MINLPIGLAISVVGFLFLLVIINKIFFIYTLSPAPNVPRNTNGMKWRAEARSRYEEINFLDNFAFVLLSSVLRWWGKMSGNRVGGTLVGA